MVGNSQSLHFTIQVCLLYKNTNSAVTYFIILTIVTIGMYMINITFFSCNAHRDFSGCQYPKSQHSS